MSRYFFRLDDIAPNMDWDNFNYLVNILKKYNIKPLLGVVPDNKDPELFKYPFNPDFWQVINQLKNDGWIVAQHGYQHLYRTKSGGILGINKKGEFSGLSFEIQKQMIGNGKDIISEKVGESGVFVAPGHSFDKSTVLALKENGFKYLSDGVALYPFKKWGLIWLPQILWWPRKIWFGQITILLHTNTEKQSDLSELEEFISKNRKIIGNFSELMDWHSRQSVITKFLTFFINQPFKILWRIVFKFKHGLSK